MLNGVCNKLPIGLAITAVLFFTVNPYIVSSAQDQVVILGSGTPVLLRLEESVSSERASMGDPVALRVVRPVQVNDIVVIKAGANAFGKVADIKRTGGFGRKGEISIMVSSVTAVDGQEVFLSATQRREGEGRGGEAAGTAIITGLFCFPLAATGFFVKGEEGIIPPGYEIKAYVDNDTRIRIAAQESIERE